jgi:dihydroorotate dehydrogenase (NAD+) catalytic subunit
MVYQVVNSVSIPVIGIGGIMCAEDALEFLLVGATAVQVGTANLINPGAMSEIISGIEAFLAQQGIDDVNAWIGTLKQ